MTLLLILLTKNTRFCVASPTVGGFKKSNLIAASAIDYQRICVARQGVSTTYSIIANFLRAISSTFNEHAFQDVPSSVRWIQSFHTASNSSSSINNGACGILSLHDSLGNDNDNDRNDSNNDSNSIYAKKDVSFSTTNRNRIEQSSDLKSLDSCERWHLNYERLRSFVESQQKDQRNPLKYHEKVLPTSLYRFLTFQRYSLREYTKKVQESTESDDTEKSSDATIEEMETRIRKLRELGFSIIPREFMWNKRYNELRRFVKKHDGKFPYDSDVCDNLNDPEKKLLRWCVRQRTLYRRMIYRAKQRKHEFYDDIYRKIEAQCENSDNDDDENLHFKQDIDWEAEDDGFNLENFHIEATYDPMSKERIQKLEEIGFRWHTKTDVRWIIMFRKLKHYRSHHGNCLVPKDYLADSRLGKWVQTQRYEYSLYRRNDPRSSISMERIDKLNSIQFTWNASDARWMIRYNELQQFVLHHGGLIPPFNPYSRLRSWLSYQSRLKDRLSNTTGEVDSESLTPRKRLRLLQKLGYFLD